MFSYIRSIFFVFAIVNLSSIVFADLPAEHRIQIQFERGSRIVSGTETVTITNTGSTPLQALYFFVDNQEKVANPYLSDLARSQHTVAGFEPSYTEIKRAVDDSGTKLVVNFVDMKSYSPPVIYNTKSSLFRVELPRMLKPGQKQNVTISFAVHLPQ